MSLLNPEMIDAIERNAEQINKMHGLDVRHHLLIQMVRELASSHREVEAMWRQQKAYADASVAVDDMRRRGVL